MKENKTKKRIEQYRKTAHFITAIKFKSQQYFLKQAVMRGISSAVKDRKDVLDLILSNLAYAVTGQDGALDVYALEKQLIASSI